MPSNPDIYVAAGALGTLVGAGLLCWYTILTSRLVKMQKSEIEPFVFLTMDVAPARDQGSLYVRNVGATSALDVVVMVDDRNVPKCEQLRRLYRCDLLSPRNGQHLLAGPLKMDTLVNGQRFIIEYRNSAGERRPAPAAMIFDSALDTYFRWDFSTKFPWGNEKR
jgi:hypothetical protein